MRTQAVKEIETPRGSSLTETYRHIEFTVQQGQTCFFRSFLPDIALHWDSWSRFFTDSEQEELDLPSTSLRNKATLMRNAIDRAWNNAPIYTGDIRGRR